MNSFFRTVCLVFIFIAVAFLAMISAIMFSFLMAILLPFIFFYSKTKGKRKQFQNSENIKANKIIEAEYHIVKEDRGGN